MSHDPRSIRQSGRRCLVGRRHRWMPPCRPGALYQPFPSSPAGVRRRAGCRRRARATLDRRTRATASVAVHPGGRGYPAPPPSLCCFRYVPLCGAAPSFPPPLWSCCDSGGPPVMQIFNRETLSRRPAARPPRRARLGTPLSPHPGTPWETPVGPHGAMPPRPRARSVWWGPSSVRVGGGREACLIRR